MDERHEELMVTIRCLAYNHEPYIRQCLEGFVIQKTNFRFEAIVHDDASTDGTAAIIREYAEKYPDIIKPIFETENQYSKRDGSINRIMDEHTHGKYVALCEGDDYWIDPLKLQKQVDYMENHSDCVLSHTGFDYLQNGFKVNRNSKDIIQETLAILDSKEDLKFAILDSNRYLIQTMTVVLRRKAYEEARKELDKYRHLFMMGDTPLWIETLSLGTIHFLPEITAYYRLNVGSACRQVDISKRFRFNLSCAEMRVYMGEKNNLSKSLLKKFQLDYQRWLLRYLCFNKSYKPFVELRFYSIYGRFIYVIANCDIVRFIMRMLYNYKYK